MYTAPSVTWQVVRLPAHAGLLTTVWCAGAAAHGVWWMQAGSPGWPHWLGLAVLASGGLVAALGWLRVGVGTLRWDGRNWAWAADGGTAVEGALAAMADFQWVMLLRLSATSGVRHWFWVARTSDMAHWLAFRRAIFARSDRDFAFDRRVAGSSTVRSTPR
jgi:hypothetical protein